MPDTATVTLPALLTVGDVEIIRAGHEWHPHTDDGQPVRLTTADLLHVVAAAQDPRLPRPVLKLGHADPRINGDQPYDYDATPALGRLTNVRLAADGQAVHADVAGVPAWLAYAWPTAYPHRSVELFTGADLARTYPGAVRHTTVLTALALLGDTWPAITALSDVPAVLGLEPMPAEPVTAKGADMPAPTSAAVTLDEIVDAIYDAETSWGLVVDVLQGADGLLVVYANDDGLWMVPVSVDGADNVAFGDAQAVRHTYTPTDTDAPQPVAAAADLDHAARPHVRGLVAAALSIPEQQPTEEDPMPEPVTPPAPAVTREQIDQLTDEQRAELGITITPPPTVAPAETVDRVSDGPEQDANQAVAEAPTDDQREGTGPEPLAASLPDGMTAIGTDRLAQYDGAVAELAALREQRRVEQRDATLDRFAAQGRMTRGERAFFAAAHDRDPDGTEAYLAARAPVVPVGERGHGTQPTAASTDRPAYPREWFPSLASTDEQES